MIRTEIKVEEMKKDGEKIFERVEIALAHLDTKLQQFENRLGCLQTDCQESQGSNENKVVEKTKGKCCLLFLK